MRVRVCRYEAALQKGGAARARRGAWAGAGAGLGWLLTYSLNAVVFAFGAELVVRDRALPPDQQAYHPGVMVTVSIPSHLPPDILLHRIIITSSYIPMNRRM